MSPYSVWDLFRLAQKKELGRCPQQPINFHLLLLRFSMEYASPDLIGCYRQPLNLFFALVLTNLHRCAVLVGPWKVTLNKIPAMQNTPIIEINIKKRGGASYS